MGNEQFQRLVLEQLKALTDGQKTLEQSVKGLEQGQAEIKSELKYICDDIKKIDSRFSSQEGEIVILKRLGRFLA